MIKVVARNLIKEGRVEEVIELYKELVEMTRKEDGCIKYELYQDEKDNKIVSMIEEWEDRHALDNHLKSEHFTRIVPMLRQLMSKETDMNIYSKLI